MWFSIFQDNCIISGSLIAEGVTLNEKVELGRGCIIGPGVVLDAGKIVLPNTRVMVTSDTAVEFLTEELCGLAVDDQGSEENASESDVKDQDSILFKAKFEKVMTAGYKAKLDFENLFSEVLSLRLAFKISMDDINAIVMEQILSFPGILKVIYTAVYIFFFLKEKSDNWSSVHSPRDWSWPVGAVGSKKTETDVKDQDSILFKAKFEKVMTAGYKAKLDFENLFSEVLSLRLAFKISMDDINAIVMEQILSFPGILKVIYTAVYIFFFLKEKSDNWSSVHSPRDWSWPVGAVGS